MNFTMNLSDILLAFSQQVEQDKKLGFQSTRLYLLKLNSKLLFFLRLFAIRCNNASYDVFAMTKGIMLAAS